MRPRALLTAIPVAAALALTACGAAPDRAGTSPSSSPSVAATAAVSRAELLRRQARLDGVAREIESLVAPDDARISTPLPSGDDRYGQVRLDLEGDRVELWWAGALPPEIRAIIAGHPEAVVDVHRARFSNDELQRAGERVASGVTGSDVVAEMIEHDVRAGRIGVHIVDPHATWTEESLRARLQGLVDVPVVVEVTRTSTLAPLGLVPSSG